MNMVRAAGGSGNKNKSDVNSVTTAKQTVSIKTETVKVVEKEKKQPTAEQIRIASLIDKNDTQTWDAMSNKIKKIKDVTCKSEDDIVTALYDCDYNEAAAIAYLLEGKQDGWETTTKKKKNRTASTSKNDANASNHGELNENSEDWDRDANASSSHPSEKSNRNFRGRRGGGRPNDRGSFNRTRWRGRENKENERGAEDGSNATGGPNRDYRGRGDRMTNGPSRLTRGFRGPRGGRGPGGTRTFQSRDNNDKGGGGFPRQIDTWNNPETDNAPSKIGDFPSPEDWDNEEYTGSLADTKVFTPSTTIEPETVEAAPTVEGETKDESLQMHLSMQSPSNATIPTMVVGSNQLTAAQTQYFNQLTAQANENRKQQAAAVQQQTPVAVQQVTVQQKTPQQVQQQQSQQQPQSSVIYNSSITSPQQPFSNAVTQPSYSGVSQSYASVTPSQSFTAMVSSQTFQKSPSSSYQSPSSMTGGSTSYSRTASEFTSSNYNEVMNNYNSMVGLQTNGALPQRSKPQRPTSRQETPTKVMPGSVEIPAADGSINAMKYLDSQFNALDFNNSDGFENTVGGSEQSSVTALSNKYAQSANAATHTDLPSMNSYQSTTQPPKQNIPSSTMVLNQNSKLSTENNLQNENSVYSSQTITNSRMAPSIQDLKNSSEVSSLAGYGLPEAYQSQQQQTTFQKTASNTSSSFHQPGTSVSNYNSSTYGASAPITSTATNVYSGQQQTSQQQQQSQISGTGVTYTTNSSASFSVYSTSHSVATATPPIHNSVYHNSSYQSHPSVTASFQSYGLYPSSIMQPYQAGAAGLTQTPYLSTQYGGGSLASLGTYGAAPFHNNYGVGSNLQTPVANVPQSHKITSSLSTSVASKESQYDSLQAITSASNNTATTTSGSVISGLSQASTTTSSKVSSSSSSGGKSSSVLPSIPPGVQPLLGPQYIMSQGVPVYQPAFAVNYDDLQYLQRGMHPHMPTGYLDWPQTNIAAAGRDALSVPFSSISDGRFPRPDNTTSPVPPTAAAAAAAGASLPQQNTAPAHQQPHVPLLQTYATAYIYPPYQQYTAPVYQVAPTGTPAAPGSSNSAGLTATQFAKAPTGYSSTGYASQYDSLGSNQGNVADYGSKGNSANTYSNTQPSSKTNSNTGSVSSQNANPGNADLSMYGKSHTSLTKSYDKQTFHSGTPPPFTMPGSGTTSSNLGSNASGATGYGTQLYIPGGVPTAAAAAHQQHHLHQNAHHQDDIRSSGTNERNFFMSNSRSSYR